MKILHLEYDQYPSAAIELLRKSHEVTPFKCLTQEELYSHLETNKYDVIFTRLGLNLDSRCIDYQSNTLKYIATSTTGLNHINVDYANQLGIEVVSLQGEYEFLSLVKSTAEHTWGLLLMLIRQMNEAVMSTKSRKWDRNPFMSDELSENTLGIIGYGRLGKIVAKYGVAFGMKVLVYDCDEKKTIGLPNGIQVVDFSSLLDASDYVVLLINYDKKNNNFIGSTAFNKMKKDAYFINTSRGELVNEEDLLSALTSGKLKGAALDVLKRDSSWAGEVEGENKLIEYASIHSNLIITPHMGGYGKDSVGRTRQFVTEKLLSKI